jgi:hypothetical protein
MSAVEPSAALAYASASVIKGTSLSDRFITSSLLISGRRTVDCKDMIFGQFDGRPCTVDGQGELSGATGNCFGEDC